MVDEAFADESIQLTSAFYAEHSQDAYFLAVLASLRDGADDVATCRAGVEALVPQEPIEFQTLERIEKPSIVRLAPNCRLVLGRAPDRHSVGAITGPGQRAQPTPS